MAFRDVFLLAILCLPLIYCKSVQKLTCKQIKQFVDGHNSRRFLLSQGKVPGQPAAAEMKYMVWDDELAAKAAKWAAENHNYHNPDNTVGSGRFRTGENLYWYSTTDRSFKLNVGSALDAWWDEHKDYRYGPLKASDFSSSVQIGHYTQVRTYHLINKIYITLPGG
ncbi:scoloptoxin SSD976, partial [Manduca sexta]|uniref:scoloptoxin SSD976 n=2 Tax=Manduca sexta TaxID=7130 RepID=UPI00188E4BB9